MSKGKILFADDEERMQRLVRDYLLADGFDVVCAGDGRKAVETFDSDDDFDLVILDVMMPRMDGYKALEEIKKIKNVPVILLTAKGGEYDELLGFRLGVDEYITKPFRPKILIARVNAVLNRGKLDRENRLCAGGICMDRRSRSVSVDDVLIELTGKEFELLEYFLINKNLVCSRDMILDNVWDKDFYGDERTVDTHVKKLRAKLLDKGEMIKTVWAVGYKFEEA